ncbi:hypothetical protein ACHAXT_004549 [Thalassiosira profunda]
MLLELFRSSKPDEASQESPASVAKTEAQKETGVDADALAFAAYAEESGLPSSSEWPAETPLLVVPSHRAPDVEYDISCNDSYAAESRLPLNGSAVPFDGPHFEGKLVSRVRDVPTTPLDESSKMMSNREYFQNRSRQYQWTVQGRFKKRIRFDKIVTGQEFGRPFRNAPSSRVVKRGLDLLKHKLPETFECDLFAEEPRFEHPLLAGCQHFRVDRPEDIEGVSPGDIHGVGDDGNVMEDTSLLEDDSIPADGVARRKYFSRNCNLERHFFEPGLVYTFDFFANFFSPARHRLELTPFFSVDLIPYFNGYPLFMSMAKEKDSQEYLWATELWHRRLLVYEARPGRLARFFCESRSETEAETVCSEDEDG